MSWIPHLKVFALSFAIVFWGYSIFLYWNTNTHIATEYLLASGKLAQTHAFVYGVVESVDQNEKRIVVVRPHPHDPSLPPQRISFKIDPRTVIFEERLFYGSDNIYSGMSARTPRTFDDLTPRTSVEVLPIILKDSPAEIVAYSIIFGNPL